MILVIDNYDSFTYNLVQYLGELGAELCVRRNTEVDGDEIAEMRPSKILISPGPGRPESAGVTLEAIRRFGATMPILGVCLGHQAIGMAYGGTVTPAWLGAHGPGDTTMAVGRSSPISSTATASFRRTTMSAPSSPRYWTRL